MDGIENQQQLLVNSSAQATNKILTDDTLVTDALPEAEVIRSAITEILEWNTSMISEVIVT
jgi:hypothetical protein